MEALALALAIFAMVGFVLLARKGGSASPGTSNPVEEARMYLNYGRTKLAEELLRKHVAANPGDLEALRLLDTIK